MKTRLIWITPEAEKVIMYCARVSNPGGQENESTAILRYCIRHGHWSIYEMANACFEIETSRAITTQILRHKSFNFQEFSLRYASADLGMETYEARRQDEKNRQNSIDDMPVEDKEWFLSAQKKVYDSSFDLYKEALSRGIAKEQARFLLPLSTSSRIYMNGSIRSWIHYLGLRSANGTQKEHMDIANSIKSELSEHLPNIASALGWR